MNMNKVFKKWTMKTRKLYALVISIVTGSYLTKTSLKNSTLGENVSV